MDITPVYDLFLASKGLSIDTRSLSEGEMFVAIKGENFNGNKFVKEALQKGASCVIVTDRKYKSSDSRVIFSELSGEQILQNLATFHRSEMRSKIIAVTGSNGKTTTKELFNSVLSNTYKTLSTKGNLNNHIGVPLTLLRIEEDTEITIVEMGANHHNEISFLCEIAQPDYAYITSFGKAHLDGFGSIDGVIKAKKELYDYVKDTKGLIFYNADDSIQTEACQSYSRTFSFSEKRLSNAQVIVTSDISFLNILYEKMTIHTHLIGRYNVPNIAAAIAVGKYFNVEKSIIKSALESYIPTNNRSQLIKIYGDNINIIADAYNANPSSMQVALKSLSCVSGKKLAILGDMFELGEYAKEEHQMIVNLAKRLKISTIIVGGYFSQTISNFPKFKTYEMLESYLQENKPHTDTTILVKGSRGMRLERVIDFIRQKLSNH